MDHIIENLFSSGDVTDPTVAKSDSDNLMLDAKFRREPFRLGGETKSLQSDPSAVRDIGSSRNFVEIPSTSRAQKEVANHTEPTSDSDLTDLESDVDSRESSDSETSQLGHMTDFPRVLPPLVESKDLEPDSIAVLDIGELSDSVGIAPRRHPSRTQRFKTADSSLDRVRADLESNTSDDQSSQLAELEFSRARPVRPLKSRRDSHTVVNIGKLPKSVDIAPTSRRRSKKAIKQAESNSDGESTDLDAESSGSDDESGPECKLLDPELNSNLAENDAPEAAIVYSVPKIPARKVCTLPSICPIDLTILLEQG
jgi:hypothetical protein